MLFVLIKAAKTITVTLNLVNLGTKLDDEFGQYVVIYNSRSKLSINTNLVRPKVLDLTSEKKLGKTFNSCISVRINSRFLFVFYFVC